MKHFVVTLFFLALSLPLEATKFYHPHISRVEITFGSGDRVVLETEFTNASLKRLSVVSRKGIEYLVPESAIKGVQAPRLDTMRITFHENSSNVYREGSFQLSFNHGADSANDLNNPDVQIFYEDGVYIGGFDEWFAHQNEKSEKSKAAQPGATDNPDDAPRLREDY